MLGGHAEHPSPQKTTFWNIPHRKAGGTLPRSTVQLAGMASGRPGSGPKGEPPHPVQTPLVGFSAKFSEPLIQKVGRTSPQRQSIEPVGGRLRAGPPSPAPGHVAGRAKARVVRTWVAQEVRLDAGGPRVPRGPVPRPRVNLEPPTGLRPRLAHYLRAMSVQPQCPRL